MGQIFKLGLFILKLPNLNVDFPIKCTKDVVYYSELTT